MLDCAARWPRRNTCASPATSAIRSSKARRLSAFFFSRVTSPDSVPILSALRMETVMRSGLAGLTRKSLAPARIASTAESMPPLAVSTMTGRSGWLARSFARTVKAVHVGHDEIEQHQRDLIAARTVDQIERGLTARRGHHLHAGARDRRFQQPALHGIVVDNENGLRHALVPGNSLR